MEELLSTLRNADVKLSVEGDRLRYSAPQGALTPELLEQVRSHKAELIALLTQENQRFNNDTDTYDVAICGGGLAGLTLARQLKLNMPNLSVVLLDRLGSPLPEATFKVGESTVEVGAFYLAEVLQLTDYFEQEHLLKLGLRYFFGDTRGAFHERPELGLSEFHLPNSYQIDRGKLENDLRRLNAQAGVKVLENCLVRDIELAENPDDPHQVIYTQCEGKTTQTLNARWVVDAMGRRRLLQRKLGLAKPNNESYNAVWFRVEGRFDLSDFVPRTHQQWHNRVPNDNRFYSTNHLCGDGYWVWTIPLSTGHTSIGIVAREDLQPFSSYHTYELAYQWLQDHEPAVASHLEGLEPKDFMKMPRYSYSSTQVFSFERWACVGEAGVFPDPFYSPGSNMIGFCNSLTTQLIQLDLAGKLTPERVDEANNFFLTQSDGTTWNIQTIYACFGNGGVAALKIIWDFVSGWAFSCPLMYNSIFLDPEQSAKVGKIVGRFLPLSHRVQQLFLDWASKSQRRLSFEFIDYLAIPFVHDLRERNLKINKTEQEILDDHIASMEILEEFAQVIFLLAVEDTMPEVLTKFSANPWINAWAISLDVNKWQSDGLFQPKTSPRDLSRIQHQLRQMIRCDSAMKELVKA